MCLLLLITLCDAYKSLTYTEIESKFIELKQTCHFLTTFIAQEKYDLPYPDKCNNCSHLVAVITNSDSPSTPQIYFSGCLHGDERLGPVVVTELADYLCSEYHKNSWIKRLVDTRRIILTPMTNAVGYYRSQREEYRNEKYYDPNRDFPYDNPGQCFESIASRVIAKIFEENLIRIGITFHGGDSSLTYPWGSFNHMSGMHSTEAPDFYALKSIANSIGHYSEAEIRIGTMTDIVYAVHGGLEDWAYGGEWSNTKIPDCSEFKINNPETIVFVQTIRAFDRD